MADAALFAAEFSERAGDRRVELAWRLGRPIEHLQGDLPARGPPDPPPPLL